MDNFEQDGDVRYDYQKDFTPEYLKHIRYVCLVFSEDYIRSNYQDIVAHADIIERRLDDGGLICSVKEFSSDFEHTTPFGGSAIEKEAVMIDREVKAAVLEQLCYTELVFGRINKKLKMNLEPDEIRRFVDRVVRSEDCVMYKRGKNYYACNENENVSVTINSFNFRVITADRLHC